MEEDLCRQLEPGQRYGCLQATGIPTTSEHLIWWAFCSHNFVIHLVSLFISAGIVAQSASSVVAVNSTDCMGDEFHLQSCTSFQFQHNLCTSRQTVMLTCVGK